MKVYALIYTVSVSQAQKYCIGVYGTLEKAEEAKQADMTHNRQPEWHYSIHPVEINKTINKAYAEW